MIEDSVFSLRRPVWGVETPALLQRGQEKEENVERRSGDGNCGSELEVRLKYLDSGGWIFGD